VLRYSLEDFSPKKGSKIHCRAKTSEIMQEWLYKSKDTNSILVIHIRNKEKCDCTVNEQTHTYNTRNNKDYHKYGHNLELYNNKPSVAACIFYNKLPSNIKQIENKNHFERELKKLLIKGCYYSIEDYLNEEF
jgi:hypothetical protein